MPTIKAVYKCWALDQAEPRDYDRCGNLYYVYGTRYDACALAADWFGEPPTKIALRVDEYLTQAWDEGERDLAYYYDERHFELANAGYDDLTIWSP